MVSSKCSLDYEEIILVHAHYNRMIYHQYI
jgi:hypothetical protein